MDNPTAFLSMILYRNNIGVYLHTHLVRCILPCSLIEHSLSQCMPLPLCGHPRRNTIVIALDSFQSQHLLLLSILVISLSVSPYAINTACVNYSSQNYPTSVII